jgi:hypothetical protein
MPESRRVKAVVGYQIREFPECSLLQAGIRVRLQKARNQNLYLLINTVVGFSLDVLRSRYVCVSYLFPLGNIANTKVWYDQKFQDQSRFLRFVTSCCGTCHLRVVSRIEAAD